jgi:hypothetical protein
LRKVVARQHHVGDAVHELVDQCKGQADGARGAFAAARTRIEIGTRVENLDYGFIDDSCDLRGGFNRAGSAVGEGVEQGVIG